jgi:hypothetical protein
MARRRQASHPIYTPRARSKMLDWYGDRLEAARQTVMLTPAFVVMRRLADRIDNDPNFLRFLLLECKNHFFFRYIAQKLAHEGSNDPAKAAFLDPIDGWVQRHFTPDRYHSRRRELFRAP